MVNGKEIGFEINKVANIQAKNIQRFFKFAKNF